MKKLTSILLVLILILGLNTTAFAADDNVTVTVDDPAGNRVYNGYQLLTLSVSLKPAGTHPEGCNKTNAEPDHLEACYNYAYQINPYYMEILQAETLAGGRNDIWLETGKPEGHPEKVTEKQILQYLSLQSGDSGETYGTLRLVAERLYTAIVAANIQPEAESISDTAAINQGYWMFVDVTDLNGKNEANSLIVMDTKGREELIITPKTDLPTLKKKVKDIEDTEDSKIEDNAWHDSADHDIAGNLDGDNIIPFKLTATLPDNIQYYESYKLVFHDNMSDGLTVKQDSFKVLVYGTEHKADADTDLNDIDAIVLDPMENESDNSYDYKVFFAPTCERGCDFHVEIENALLDGVTKDSAFVVYYEATLNDSAVIGGAGNPNTAWLEYSNNPYDSADKGITVEDTAVVYTYQFVVNKTDGDHAPLKGANFTLEKKVLKADGTTEYKPYGRMTVSNDGTTFTWTGLDDGDYLLTEETIPEGYNGMQPVVFSVTAVHTETGTTTELTELNGGVMGMGDVVSGQIVKEVMNQTGIELPSTGGAGTMMLIGGGSMLIILAAVFMITRNKMSIYED